MFLILSDKTQVFHDKIQVKQKELQPWTAQINAKQAEIDVATSERDALAKKADTLRAQCKEADEALNALKAERDTKVHLTLLLTNFMLNSSRWKLTKNLKLRGVNSKRISKALR